MKHWYVLYVFLYSFVTWLCFYQTRSAWSRDQGSNKNHSPAYNFAPTVTKFCVMWEGLSLLHDTKFSNCRCKIVDSSVFPIWSLIHGSSWSGLIKAEPDVIMTSSNGNIFRLTGPLCQSPVNSPHKGQRRGDLMFSLICAWITCWVNNREAGDLRRHCAHYDITVMWW